MIKVIYNFYCFFLKIKSQKKKKKIFLFILLNILLFISSDIFLMSDRYFKNNYSDYNGEQYLTHHNQVCCLNFLKSNNYYFY
jgi:hypothetical protein